MFASLPPPRFWPGHLSQLLHVNPLLLSFCQFLVFVFFFFYVHSSKHYNYFLAVHLYLILTIPVVSPSQCAPLQRSSHFSVFHLAKRILVLFYDISSCAKFKRRVCLVDKAKKNFFDISML